MSSLQIISADITTLEVDAIVNAANSALSGGGGVDGAIHRVAGPELLAACRKLGRCETGNVVMTDGFLLPARKVIHAVGPVWYGGDRNEDALLASCYSQAMALAIEHDFSSIAFPAISCGVYRFPLDRASMIAVKTILNTLDHAELDLDVSMVCFDQRVKAAFEKAYSELK